MKPAFMMFMAQNYTVFASCDDIDDLIIEFSMTPKNKDYLITN